MSYINQVVILQCSPPLLYYCTLPKKDLFFPFSLGMKRIHLETQLKGDCADLF